MQACSGGQSVDGGGGGGGHAGGGGGVSQIDEGAYNVGWENVYGAGGGGGSSWAAGAGAGITLPVSYAEWQYLTDESSSQVVVTVHCNSCGFEIPGLVQTIGHRYPDNNANFNDVAGVAWDSTNGHVLVIDGNWIKVFSAMNNEPIFSYVHTLGGNGFSSPQGVAWDDTNHRILVADTGNQRVQVLQPNGTVIGVFGNDILLSPSGIDWDSVNQRIVVTDEDVDSNLIYFFDANGNSLSSFKTPKNGAPSDVAWHGDTGYITDVENDVVWRCPDSGQGCVSIGQPGNGLNGTFSFPIGVAWDTTNERILVGNTSSGASGDIESVQAFDPNSRLLYSYSIDDFSTYIPAGVIGVEWAAAPAWLLIADPINNDIDVLYQWPD
jgi:DNA-binding beta-propeller fold protein YncE